MTSSRTSASHQIFCPIKCSLESESAAPLCYKYHLAKVTVDTSQSNMGRRCVFGCSNARVLLHLPTVCWLRMNLPEYIHPSTIPM